ncbi:hypothetical protein FALCPG4_015023 [Fusarium falciforme]
MAALSSDTNAGFDQAALERLGACIQSYIDNGQTYGASVIVARGGEIGFQKCFGTVNGGDRKIAEDDIFLTMSLSKSFTAAAALRAIDHGYFTLDTKISSVIPAFEANDKKDITVRHCMTHTSGLFGGFIPPGIAPQDLSDLDAVAKAIAAVPVAFPHGTRSSYTPAANHAVIAHVVALTDPKKRSFTQVVEEEVFNPLGMTETKFGAAVDESRRVPVAITERQTTPSTPATINLLEHGIRNQVVPAGSAFCTVGDAFRFAEVMRLRGSIGNYKLLSKAMFDYAVKNHTGVLMNEAWTDECRRLGIKLLPANFTLLGGYVNDTGHLASGVTASPRAFFAIGGGSTMWFVDPDRDMTFVFFSSGFIEGLAHSQRLSRLVDLALAACN